MGNSLGSVIALNAATGDYAAKEECSSTYLRSRVKGICMFSCSIGMNSRNLLLEYTGIQKAILAAIFDLFDVLIFKNTPLLAYILDKAVTRDLLRNALVGLYQCADSPTERVDDALVDSFYYPAKDPGSPETLSQIYMNDPGKTPMALYRDHEEFLGNHVPVHLVWGEQDGVAPLQGPVGQFFQELSNDPDNKNISIDVIHGGHIPFDEVPACNDLMLKWLDEQARIQKKESGIPTAFGGFFKLPFL
jgi:pimeloyl-ACP methyl ester carboxylesterase